MQSCQTPIISESILKLAHYPHFSSQYQPWLPECPELSRFGDPVAATTCPVISAQLASCGSHPVARSPLALLFFKCSTRLSATREPACCPDMAFGEVGGAADRRHSEWEQAAKFARATASNVCRVRLAFSHRRPAVERYSMKSRHCLGSSSPLMGAGFIRSELGITSSPNYYQFINRWTFDPDMRRWTEVMFAFGGDHRYRGRSRCRLLQTHKTDWDCDPDPDPDGYGVLLSFRFRQMSTYL
jgi:hypothetical protein